MNNKQNQTIHKPLIIHGVSGSIAAHKAIDLVSMLVKKGADVHVVLTQAALRFVQPLPFQTLSRNLVITDLFEEQAGWQPTHIELATKANLLLVAPATADIIAKLALGIADEALLCIALALPPQTPILIAPAMNHRMWLHPATQSNVATLKARGVEFIGPEEGLLACGEVGPGRLANLDVIVNRIYQILAKV